jgi:hypothetical protein
MNSSCAKIPAHDNSYILTISVFLTGAALRWFAQQMPKPSLFTATSRSGTSTSQANARLPAPTGLWEWRNDPRVSECASAVRGSGRGQGEAQRRRHTTRSTSWRRRIIWCWRTCLFAFCALSLHPSSTLLSFPLPPSYIYPFNTNRPHPCEERSHGGLEQKHPAELTEAKSTISSQGKSRRARQGLWGR